MKTSASQFQLLVDFMERYGDLSKPTEGPQGRITNMQRWAELTQILNADATGDTKTAEKWRKVWSDYKNNIKKKAARIHRATLGTGGGPASNLRLNDLEQKVLSIVGSQAATGIVNIPEIGLEEIVGIIPPPEANDSPSILIEHDEQNASTTMEDWNRPGTSRNATIMPPLHEVDGSQSEQTSVTNNSGPPVVESRGTGGLTEAAARTPPPLRPTSERRRAPLSPTPLPPTPRRRQRGRLLNLSSPIHRRTRTQTQSDLARQAFVRSDCEWRAFQQETEQERNRLRQEELRSQERWQELFGQFLVLGNRVLDILERNNRE